MSADVGYETTPAAVARQALGGQEPPPPGEFTDAEREELRAAFRFAWGWEDAAGRLTRRGEERKAQWEHAQFTRVRASWIELDEAQERELARRMRAAQEARQVADRMETDAASMMAETWRRLNGDTGGMMTQVARRLDG